MYTLTWTWSETNWFYLQCLLAITVTHWSYSETLAAQTTWWSTTHPSCLMHDWTKRNVFFNIFRLSLAHLLPGGSWAANSKWHQFIIMGGSQACKGQGTNHTMNTLSLFRRLLQCKQQQNPHFSYSLFIHFDGTSERL